MSCRTTRGGAVSLRLARHYSGLPDKDVQALFHSLKREGQSLPPPTTEDKKIWQVRQRALIEHSDLTHKSRERAELDVLRSNDENPDGALFHAWSRIEVRSRQEAAIRAVETATDLEPPGSQSQKYVRGPDGRPTQVWYASYGSNMDEARFLTYIHGGTPEGTGSSHVGARDRTDPSGSLAIRFPGRMHFAYSSGRWDGGGVAFLDTDSAGHALGRAYLITSSQFDDVVYQENGRIPRESATPLPISEAITEGQVKAEGLGLYNTLVHIGDYDNAPVITFTGDFTAQESLREGAALDRDLEGNPFVASNEPSPNYMRMIGRGLKETFNMTEWEQADYLRGGGGAEEWPRRLLLRTLRTPPTPPKTKKTTTASATPTSPQSPAFLAAWEAETRSRDLRSGGFRFGGPKLCPLCGNGHNMHDCPIVNK